ncbi:hypothetical protein, partial [Streptococcus sobrinus]|uniref:hypothetical protein n=1 Tax=Streptococcus sobrinus TaxID=1310 RepID=UPI0004926957
TIFRQGKQIFKTNQAIGIFYHPFIFSYQKKAYLALTRLGLLNRSQTALKFFPWAFSLFVNLTL